MADLPLPVAISALIKDNNILLIKRIKGDYVGLLGLPGGKIESHEHLTQAAVREVLEESGIESEFNDYLGVVSELLIENGSFNKHLLLHICELTPKTGNISKNQEGQLEWFDLNEIHKIKEKIIPSDYLIIDQMIRNRGKMFIDCILEKKGDSYCLKKFE